MVWLPALAAPAMQVCWSGDAQLGAPAPARSQCPARLREQQPPTGPPPSLQLARAGGSHGLRSDPISFQFSLKPLQKCRPCRPVGLSLPELTRSVPMQSEVSIFVVQYLYTILKCFYEILSNSP